VADSSRIEVDKILDIAQLLSYVIIAAVGNVYIIVDRFNAVVFRVYRLKS
jgi:hypothetical protein